MRTSQDGDREVGKGWIKQGLFYHFKKNGSYSSFDDKSLRGFQKKADMT